MRWRWLVLIVCVALSPLHLASAQDVETSLSTGDEQRARKLFKQLRCVVCQNQSIDGSDADVAKDLRAIVREQIHSGQTDTQITSFLVARYGEFILLKPKFAIHTLILWLAPLGVLLFGMGLAWHFRRRQVSSGGGSLSEDEENRLSEILNNRE